MNTLPHTRPSPIAGSWYPADADLLAAEINGYLAAAALPALKVTPLGLIAPHAGYFYSGATAGYAYRTVQGLHFDLCVVASPLHNYLPHPLLSSAHTAYATPLGDVKIDHDLLSAFDKKLTQNGLPGIQLIGGDREHSLEIQLPFLQCALEGDFCLLPIMVRSSSASLLMGTGQILAELLQDKKVLLVASTDLSHFFDERTANSFDEVMLQQMSSFSPTGVLQAEADDEGFACGSGAVALVLWTAQALGANKVTLLHHSTSADASGDRSSVVGYGALAITREEAI